MKSALIGCTLIFGLVAGPANQGPTPQPRTLKTVLQEIERKTGIHTVAVAFLESQEIQGPNIDDVTAENIETQLKTMVAKLPIPSRLVKLMLPKGPSWSAEELMTYAKAVAALFRKPVGEPKADSIEILAQSLAKDKAQPAIDSLNLKPVYVITLKQGYFGGVWQTTYGEMRLTQNGTRVSGVYSTNQGKIEGQIFGNELRFQWYEELNGTSGSGAVQLGEDGISFSGPWWNDTDPEKPAGTWTGTRMKGQQRDSI